MDNDSMVSLALSPGPTSYSNHYVLLTNQYRAYVTPVVALLGILGNLLVIITFLSEKQMSRFSIYCIVLSGVHILSLFMNSILDDFMGRGLNHIMGTRIAYIKLDTISNSMCRFMEYIPNVMYSASSHLLFVFSVDRILTIYHPLKFYSIYFKKTALIVSLTTIVVDFILNIPILMVYRLITSESGVGNNHTKCDMADFTSSLTKASIRIKIIGSFIVPTFAILITNAVICAKLMHLANTRSQLLPGDTKGNSMEMSRVVGHLALSTFFLLLTIPLVVVMILRQYADEHQLAKTDPEYNAIIADLSRLFSSLKDVAYAADFFLYFIFLRNFRWRLARLCCCACLSASWFTESAWGSEFVRRVNTLDSNSRRRPSTAAISILCRKSLPNAASYLATSGSMTTMGRQDTSLALSVKRANWNSIVDCNNAIPKSCASTDTKRDTQTF